jgi:uncharacterized delta-60 repeat protein
MSIARFTAARVSSLLCVVLSVQFAIAVSAQTTVDPTFNAVPSNPGTVGVVAVQADGKVLVAGPFTQMNGSLRPRLARVNADGSLDASFDPGNGFDGAPEDIVIQPDGRILAAGPFTIYNGDAVPGLVRINSTGARDTSFNPTISSYPRSIALQSDGKILIGGNFDNVNGTARTGVARLSADGSLDATFNPVIGSPLIKSIYQQADGKIVIGGSFSGVNGWVFSNFARLNADGSTDVTLFARDVPSVENVYPLPNGEFHLLHVNGIGLRHASGDYAFFFHPAFSSTTSDTQLHDFFVQPDRSIIVAGRFDTVGAYTRPNITRLAPNGTLDVLYMNSGANGRVRTFVPYSADKLIVGGDFTTIDTIPRAGIARLNITPFRAKTPYDFNGDGIADFTVYRPSSGVWWELFSGGTIFEAPVFGVTGDIPVPADFDGDGKTDEAIFRPSNGDWWYQSSINGAQLARRYGVAGDIPIPGDFDGDGKADSYVFRPSTNVWYRWGTLSGELAPYFFGLAGDKPVLGDFDGDGKTDMAVFRPSNGYWVYITSASGGAVHWGIDSDIPAPADFDGDGRTEFAVYRPSEGVWYILHNWNGSYTIVQFGIAGDKPVPADYDGDGKADIAVFRPSTGVWYVLQSTSGVTGVQWGISSDVAIPNAFVQQ